MSYAITFLIEEEPMTLVFSSLQAGLRVIESLEANFELRPHEEDIEHIRSIRAISGFYLSQPLFVDSMSNAVDFRLGTPKSALCRTTTTADLISISELQELEKREAKPPIITESVPTSLEPMGSLAPPPLFTQNAKFIPRQIVDNEQLSKPIQTLIALCSKNHEFIEEMAEYVGQTYLEGDQEGVRALAVAVAAKILSLPIYDQIQRIEQIPFSGELKEKVLQIMQKEASQSEEEKVPSLKVQPPMESIPPKPAFPLFQPEKQLEVPQIDISYEEKIKEVHTVLRQLPSDAVSKLMHGQSPPAHLLNAREILSEHEFNVVRFKEDQRKLGSGCYTGIFDRILEVYNKEVAEHKNRFEIADPPAMRDKIIGLEERYAGKHEEFMRKHEMIVFHRSFSLDENIIILLKVRECIRPAVELYDYSKLLSGAEARHLLLIFEKLKNIVDEHKCQAPHSQSGGVVQEHSQHEPVQTPQEFHPSEQFLSAGRTDQLPGLPPPPLISFQQSIMPNLQVPSFQPITATFPQPPPIPPAGKEELSAAPPTAPELTATPPTPPIEQQEPSAPVPQQAPPPTPPAPLLAPNETRHMSQQEEQIYEDVKRIQDKLEPPSIQRIQDIEATCKPIVSAKIFVTILGLGYQYQHLFVLEQSLIHKQAEVLVEQLKVDIELQEFKNLVDTLLLSLICFIIRNKSDERFQFTQRQRPQLVRITPQTQAEYEVPQFFSIYEHTCDVLKTELSKGCNIQQKTEFEVFMKEELLEMFEGVNIFGDYLEMISCSIE